MVTAAEVGPMAVPGLSFADSLEPANALAVSRVEVMMRRVSSWLSRAESFMAWHAPVSVEVGLVDFSRG